MADVLSASAEAVAFTSADLNDKRSGGVRAFLDVFDPDFGIEGWAVDVAKPEVPVRLQLMVGETVVAECVTGRPRDDVAAIVKAECQPGFLFTPQSLAALRNLDPSLYDGQMRVRAAGSRTFIKSKVPQPDLGFFIRQVGSATATSPAGSTGMDDQTAPSQFGLLSRLSALRARAQDLTDRVFRAGADRPSGRIESVALDDNGYVWVMGWMRRGTALDFPAVIIDGQKIAGGFSFTCYDREDLGPGAVAIIGILQSDWRPTPSSEMYLYLGEDARLQLQGARPLRMLSKTEFMDHFASVRASCHTGNTQALQNALVDPVSWTPSASGAPFPIKAAIDEVLVLAPFGCIVSGWILSPLKPVASLALKIGSTVLTANPNAAYSRPRPDLDGIFPGAQGLIQKAGFVSVFEGEIPASDLSAPILKVNFTDGTSINFPVEPHALRRVSATIGLDAVLRLYPSLDGEPFFGAFAQAIKTEARAQLGEPQIHVAAKTRKAFVFTVPEDRSELYFLVDEIGRKAGGMDAGTGVVLIASRSALRGEAIALHNALARNLGPRCSLVFVDDAAYAFYMLPEILKALEIDRFVYVGAGIHLSPQAWSAADTAMATTNRSLNYIAIEQSAQGGVMSRQSAECFIWTTQALTDSMVDLPFMLGGFDGAGLSSTAQGEVYTGALLRARRAARPRIIREINQL